MYIIGQASKEEINEMIIQGWVVGEVEKSHFNKALDSTYSPDIDIDLNNPDAEKLVSVFVDNDISKQLTDWHNEKCAHNRIIQEEELHEARKEILQEHYEEMEMQVDQPVIASAGIVTDGNHYIQTFYYESQNKEEDSIKGSFHVYFEEGTDKVIEMRPGDDVPCPD